MSAYVDPKTGMPANPNAAAKETVEEAFKDAVKAKIASLFASTAIADVDNALTNALSHLKEVRDKALATVDRLFPGA